MSCLTKKLLILLFVSTSFSAMYGQIIDSTIVKVTGVYSYEKLPYKMTMEFSLEENGQTCGPDSQFSSIDEQYSYLLDSLNYDQNITSRITEIHNFQNLASSYPRRTYSFETNDIDEFQVIRKHAEYAFAEDFNYYHHFEPSRLEDQDIAASKALEDAQEKIARIVKNLNSSSYQLIAIDDATSSIFGIADYLRSAGLSRSNEITKRKITGRNDTSNTRQYNLDVYYKLN